MKKFFIETTRKNFLNLKNTKEDCHSYMKTALEEKGLQNLKENELSEQLDSLSKEFNEILDLIKEQEFFIERKTTCILFPKFFIRNLIVKRRMKSMKKNFNDFVQEKSNFSFNDYKTYSNK